MGEVTLYAFKTGENPNRKIRFWKNSHHLDIKVGDSAFLANRDGIIQEVCRYKIICDKDDVPSYCCCDYNKIKSIMIKKEIEPQIEDIEISEHWQLPNENKIKAKLDYYNANSKFLDSIILRKGNDKKYRLVDGYTTFLICRDILKSDKVKASYFE